MLIVSNIKELRSAVRGWRQAGERIGFVPTMGNLHAGHISLVTRSQQDCNRTVVSIFVNPTQFGPNEDFDAYPRTLDEDKDKLEAAGVDLLFIPQTSDIYPELGTGRQTPKSADSGKLRSDESTRVVVPQVTDYLCGASRPGHFDGVSTVVSILFNLVMPDAAIFGNKDYQQLAVIKKMVADLHLPIEIIGAAIHRDSDGLAMSSRNQYLTAEQRAIAPLLHKTLQELATVLGEGCRERAEIEQQLEKGIAQLTAQGFAVDYLDIRQPDLNEIGNNNYGDLVVLVAAVLGKARLIDNLEIPALEKRGL